MTLLSTFENSSVNGKDFKSGNIFMHRKCLKYIQSSLMLIKLFGF